ncbi:MAG TPA: hypothetical protein VF331_20325 [Polyangiales bacterium]
MVQLDAGGAACRTPDASESAPCRSARCTGPLSGNLASRTFVPGGKCRFLSPHGFVEGSCLSGRMHFREQDTVGGPWIEYWDDHGNLVAEDFGSDLVEFCGGSSARILFGDVTAADACEASHTDEHVVCTDEDAGT